MERDEQTTAEEAASPDQVSGEVPGVRLVDHEAGEVPVSMDDRQVIELVERDRVRRLYVRPVKRRYTRQIWAWLTWLRDSVTAQNAGDLEQTIYRGMDELALILREHLVGWEGMVDPRDQPMAFDPDRLDEALDDGEVLTAASELYRLSTAGAFAKKRLGSLSPSSSSARAGSMKGQAASQPREPSSSPSASGASGVTGGIPAGGGGGTPAGGTRPPSLGTSGTVPEPPEPLNLGRG